MSTIEIVSVSGGKFHRPDNTSFNGDGNTFRDARLMRCGRSLVPLNVFETIADAYQYTCQLERHICQQCERKVSHLWRVPEVLKNGIPQQNPAQNHAFQYITELSDKASLENARQQAEQGMKELDAALALVEDGQ